MPHDDPLPTAAAAVPSLPPGPYRIANAYGRRSLTAGLIMHGVGVGFLALAVALLWAELPRILRDREIWRADDAVTVPAEFDGEVRSKLGLFPRYSGTVRYPKPDGAVGEGQASFTTLVEVDTEVPIEVRFRAAEPDDFVLSWAGENVGARLWAQALLASVVGLVLPGLCFFTGWRSLGQRRFAQALSEDGEATLARVTGIDEQRQHGRIIVRRVSVEIPTADGVRKVVEPFQPKQGLPFFVDDERTLALTSARFPKRAIVLRHDLWPLELVADTRRGLLEAHPQPPGP